ncbi:MAG: hypothetical protein FJW39_08895 [Acidobacteria bacterium]|nr:hypothetical protein [Acidobacteriota bacterium]
MLLLILALTCAAQGITITDPLDGSTRTRHVVFRWAPQPGPGQFYDFRLFDRVTGELELKLRLIGNITDTVYMIRSGSFRWELRACNPTCGQPAISNFTVALPSLAGFVPDATCFLLPVNGEHNVDCSAGSFPLAADVLAIHAVQPAVGPSGGPLTVAGDMDGILPLRTPVPNLTFDLLQRFCNGDGCGPFAPPVRFTPTLPLTRPIMAEPFSGSTVVGGLNAPVAIASWNRMPDDIGSNYRYRLFIGDFSRNAAAVDILTRNNFHAAYVNPFTRYDALVIAIRDSDGVMTQSPPHPFRATGKVPNTPTMAEPTVNASLPVGTHRVAWTPLPGANGDDIARVYEYTVTGPENFTGVTQANGVGINFTRPGAYTVTVRACLTGTNCVATSDTGWGPRAGSIGSEGGSGQFTVI